MKISLLVIIILVLSTGCSSREEMQQLEEYANHLENSLAVMEQREVELLEVIDDKDVFITNYAEIISNQEEALNDLSEELQSNDIIYQELMDDYTLLEEQSVIASYSQYNHDNPYDRNVVKPTDTVCGLSVIYSDLSYTKFSGAMVVSGTFEHHIEVDVLPDCIKFTPFEEDYDLYPKEINDTRHVWLVLNDYENIREYFGEPGSKGTVTMIIDNYIVALNESCVYNQADLVVIQDIVFE